MREKAKRDKEMEKEIKTEIENKEYKENEKKKNAMKWRPKRIQKRRKDITSEYSGSQHKLWI